MNTYRYKLLFLILCLAFFLPAHGPVGQEKEKPAEKADGKEPKADQKQSTKKVDVKVYGFAKVDYKYATEATEYGGTEGLRKASNAKRKTESDDDTSRSAMQANQSRVGVKVDAWDQATATIEIDFDRRHGVDNTDVGDYFRFRKAFVTYKFTPWLEMIAGKKWDMFAPMNPKTYNITSLLFSAGNVGWIRDQAEFHFIGEKMGFHAGIGNIGRDGTVGPNNSLVHSNSPAYLAQFYTTPNPSIRIVISGITANILYYSAGLENNQPLNTTVLDFPNVPFVDPTTGNLIVPTKVRRRAGGLALGIEVKLGDRFEFSGEFVRGANLGDMYALGISKMTMKTGAGRLDDRFVGVLSTADFDFFKSTLANMDYQSTHERTGWINFLFRATPIITCNAFFGATKIEEPEYLASATGDLTRSGGATSPGDIQEAHLYGANISYELIDNFLVYFEYNFMKTIYHESERTAGILANVTSYDPTTGAVTVDVQNPWVQIPLAAVPGVTVTNTSYYNPYTLRASPKATAHMFNLGTMFKF